MEEGRSKSEAFAKELKLRYEMFSVMIGWKIFSKKEKKKGKLLLNSIFFFSVNVFSKPFIINWPRFLKSKAF